MLKYLQSSLESIEVKYPSCGLIIAGDFNKLPIQHICHQFQLKQIVNSPTRGSSKLDLILTNLAAFYDISSCAPPLRLFDHPTVFVSPKLRSKDSKATQVYHVRDKRPSTIRRLGRFFL